MEDEAEPYAGFLVVPEGGTRAEFFETLPEKLNHIVEYGWIYTPSKYKKNKYLRDAVAQMKNKPLPGEWVYGMTAAESISDPLFSLSKTAETRTYDFRSHSYVSSEDYSYSDEIEGYAWSLDIRIADRYLDMGYDAIRLEIGNYNGKELIFAAKGAVSEYFSGVGTESRLVKVDESVFSEDPSNFTSNAWNYSNPMISQGRCSLIHEKSAFRQVKGSSAA